MYAVAAILSGAGFTVAAAWAAGALLLRRLRLDLDPLETMLFAFLSGAALLSVAIFLLCAVHQARTPVLLTGGGVLIGLGVWKRPRAGKRLPPIPLRWRALLLLLVPFGFAYLANAVAPEVSPDGSGYHLGNVARILAGGGFDWSYHSMYSCFPQGLEMLFVPAVAVGGYPAAAVVHLAFLCALPALILSYGRRFQMVPAAVFAAILVFVSPVFGLTGSSAYNDAALVTLSFAVFYLLKLKHYILCDNILILNGLLVGYCIGIKYTGLVAAGFAVAALRFRRTSVSWPRFLAAVALPAAPWLLRNWLWIGNPFAPFLNRWFQNPYFSHLNEKAYLSDIGTYSGLRHWWEFPLQMTLYGGKIPGFVGPVFLLAPLALLALRRREGRRLLAAAAVFSLPVLGNAATRFLMPGMPFLALALGLALQDSPGIVPLLAAFEALVCWPSVTPLYSADWSWRLREIPVRAALRLEPESDFLRRRLPDYDLMRLVDAAAPPSVRTYSLSTRPEAYCRREILVSYESNQGIEIRDALLGQDRRRALDLMKGQGIGLLLIDRDLSSWGLAQLAESNGTKLYRLP